MERNYKEEFKEVYADIVNTEKKYDDKKIHSKEFEKELNEFKENRNALSNDGFANTTKLYDEYILSAKAITEDLNALNKMRNELSTCAISIANDFKDAIKNSSDLQLEDLKKATPSIEILPYLELHGKLEKEDISMAKQFITDVHNEKSITKENKINTNNSKDMEPKKENETTITGRIYKSEFKELENKSVLNLTIVTGKDKESAEWYKVALWNDLAKDHKDLEKGAKITVSGIEKSNPVEKDGKTYENKSIQASSIDTYQKIQIEGIVGKIEEKTIGDKNLKEVLVIHNYKENEVDKSKLYNVALWNEAIGKAGQINVGDKIKIAGEARTHTFGEDKKQSVTINNPKEIQITPKLEKEIVKEDVKEKTVTTLVEKPTSEKEVNGKEVKEKEEHKEKKVTKPKAKGMEM